MNNDYNNEFQNYWDLGILFNRYSHISVSLIELGDLNTGSNPFNDFGKAITSFIELVPHIKAISLSKPINKYICQLIILINYRS